ncbi:MAG: hypothetical protein NVSMB6_29650 [Burkholderiaceae bacterium]
MPLSLVREMGCTTEEFARWLPGATRHAPLVSQVDGLGMRHRVLVDGGTVEIELQPQAPRRIASIVVPVLRVSFRFIDLDLKQRGDFLRVFDDYTRRGGG